MSTSELPGMTTVRSAPSLAEVGSTTMMYDHGVTRGVSLNWNGEIRDGSQPTVPVLPSAVVHELRTPLTSIHGYAQILQRVLRDEPRAANALGVILRESTRLTTMLAALSELSEIDCGDAPVSPTDVDLGEVVTAAVEDASRRAARGQPILVTGTAHAHADPRRVGQAMQHVLANALAYSDPDAPIEVTISSGDGSATILVADQGVGIEAADATRVFGRFERGSKARQTGVRGLGLGLYLARAAIEATGGTIELEARHGGGTLVRISLPTP